MRTNPMSIVTWHFPLGLQRLSPKQAFIYPLHQLFLVRRWGEMLQ